MNHNVILTTSTDLLWMIRRWQKRLSLKRTLRVWRDSWRAWSRFWDSYHRYADLMAPQDPPSRSLLYPCLNDDTIITAIEPIYFYQDAWAFEHIVKQHPEFHVDVGSHHKFVALLSKVLPVTMVDLRPLSLPLNSLTFRQGSILDLPFEDGSVPSVSSLCVVEHIGLGRYGDQLDPQGTEKAIAELKRIVKPGGSLYLSIPLDDMNRIYFNAHRAFIESYLLEQFRPFEVLEQRYIFGDTFKESLQSGFGTGCYLLRCPT